MKKKLLIIVCASLFYTCTNVSEEDLVNATPINETITYNTHVEQIINNNCIECHNNPPINNAPMPLLTYENVKDAVEHRGLISRISSEDLAFSMPFGGPRLPQSLIDIIIQWEASGLIED
jgi:hypothetical protein